MGKRGWICLAVLLGLEGTGAATPGHPPEIEPLVAFEETTRARTDWAGRRRAPLGADPFRLLPTGGSGAAIGLLRGADAVVLLDAHGRETARADAPESPTGLTWGPSGKLLVVGEQSPDIAVFDVSGGTIVPGPPVGVPDAYGLRDVATLSDRVFVADTVGHRLLEVDLENGTAKAISSCQGPIGLRTVEPWLIANCLLEHSLRVFDARGHPIARIEHDGPFWSTAGVRARGELWLAAGGVENHRLDRSDGAFGYIDSYAFLYRIDPNTGEVVRLAETNLSQLGVVTPKWLELERDDEVLRLRVAGYGSEGLITLSWSVNDPGADPAVSRAPLPPGTTDVAGPLVANPLLDAWIVRDAKARKVEVAPKPERSIESRLGEALFFTTLLAPWNPSDGPRSRFTCETCHHEGYVDGRTHHTGRGEVHATTKPLVGLHGNRPYFSRALDPTMAKMVHNEFRVANRRNGHDPWFSLRLAEMEWLREIDGTPDRMSPLDLRRALMTFLIGFEHTPNPAVRDRKRFTEPERKGAELFREKCEGCHAARLVSDRAETRLPFGAWEANILTSGTIVWGRDGYERTGVTPYVHPEGARVPSLRRLYRKRPYLTNGSAPDLDAVLERIRETTGGLRHGGTNDGRSLQTEERRALLSFLDLL